MGMSRQGGESSQSQPFAQQGSAGSTARGHRYIGEVEQYGFGDAPAQAAYYGAALPAPRNRNPRAATPAAPSSAYSSSVRSPTPTHVGTPRDDDSNTTYSEAPGNYTGHGHANNYNNNHNHNGYYYHVNHNYNNPNNPATYVNSPPLTQDSLNSNNPPNGTATRHREERSRRLRHTAQGFGVPYSSPISVQVGQRSDGMLPAERYWAEAANNIPGKSPLAKTHPRIRTLTTLRPLDE